MKLRAAAQALKDCGFGVLSVSGEADPDIHDVFSDSRKVTEGSLFCCVQGEKSDGHQFAAKAKSVGAAALVCDHQVETDLPVMMVRSSRAVMGKLSSLIYERPCSKMLMVGVTGTNGKTTTTYILRSILQAAGIKTGLLGTIVENNGAREVDAERTTPESCDIQRQLAAMVHNGCGACVMETSSHGLQLGRLNECMFDVVVFTNLNPEHLDFHKDMENYFQAKRLVFTEHSKDGRIASVNDDNRYGCRILKEWRKWKPLEDVRGFSMNDVSGLKMDQDGASFTITQGEWAASFTSPLAGSFNVANVLAAVTALRGRFGDEVLVRGVKSIPQVPGRLEKYVLPNGASCFIDFAHTPEALRNVLSTARDLCKGKLISIFGHGGGRYQSNRPALGEVAASLADLVVVTMDNPSDEDPALIADGIVQGIENTIRESGKDVKYKVILDRKEAVVTALSIAGPDDVLVVSGKGPEKFLTIKGQKIPYSDAGAVEEWIRVAE